MDKVIVGISGGIDSATTALLLKQKGYRVIGVYIQTTSINQDFVNRIHKIESVLKIPIRIIDAEEEFNRNIIQYFRVEHLKGRSPSPCAICNPLFKWKILNEIAEDNNAKFIASGHYVQKEYKNGLWWLKKGKDKKKDQSYFLWGLNQKILNKIITPLGSQNKEQTKKLAAQSGLEFLLNIKESSGLCFSNGYAYTELIKRYIPESKTIGSGIIEDIVGNPVGKHKGYIFYTIGQKKDLELEITGNYCVSAIDSKRNVIVVDKPQNLWHNVFSVSDCFFVNKESVLSEKNITVKIRGFGWNPEGNVQLADEKNGAFKVKLNSPAWAPAPGQPAVFYIDDRIAGGGIIQ